MPPPPPGRIFVHQSGLEPPDPEPGDTPERSGAQNSGSDLRVSKPAMSRWSMWECLTIRLGPARVEASDVKVVHVGMPHNQSSCFCRGGAPSSSAGPPQAAPASPGVRCARQQGCISVRPPVLEDVQRLNVARIEVPPEEAVEQLHNRFLSVVVVLPKGQLRIDGVMGKAEQKHRQQPGFVGHLNINSSEFNVVHMRHAPMRLNTVRSRLAANMHWRHNIGAKLKTMTLNLKGKLVLNISEVIEICAVVLPVER